MPLNREILRLLQSFHAGKVREFVRRVTIRGVSLPKGSASAAMVVSGSTWPDNVCTVSLSHEDDGHAARSKWESDAEPVRLHPFLNRRITPLTDRSRDLRRGMSGSVFKV